MFNRTEDDNIQNLQMAFCETIMGKFHKIPSLYFNEDTEDSTQRIYNPILAKNKTPFVSGRLNAPPNHNPILSEEYLNEDSCLSKFHNNNKKTKHTSKQFNSKHVNIHHVHRTH